MFLPLNKKSYFIQLLLLSFLFLTCSKSEDMETEVIEESEEVTMEVDPNKVVTVDINSKQGEMYNFWSIRPMVTQTRFSSANFRTSIEYLKSYVTSYNMVRVLGGRTDDRNTFYQGVDASGKIITDFIGLIENMDDFMQ
ncbi:MAG: hypothetical protein AB8G22_13410, partial [Saprospiraceae bacterium]